MKQEKVLFLIFIVVFVLMALLAPAQFLRLRNFITMSFQLPEFGILALGMMIVILTGGINLSVVSGSALTGILTGVFLINSGLNNNLMLIAAAILVWAVTWIIIGLFNGLIVSYIGVSPILVTLGSMILFRGFSFKFTQGGTVSGFPEFYQWIGNGTVWIIPVPMIIFLLVVLLTYILLEKTTWGRKVYMIGSNLKAAKFSGIKVKKILVQVYLYSAFLAGISALIMTSRYNMAKATLGSSYLLQTVAASVIGGTRLSGGIGSLKGTILGVLVFQILSTGLNLVGVSRFLVTAATGLVLILVLSLNYFFNNINLETIFERLGLSK